MVGWIVIALASLFWLAVLYLVGGLILLVCNARTLRLYIFSPVFSLALIGVLALTTIFIPWNNPSIAVLEVLAVLILCLAIRLIIERQRFTNSFKRQVGLIRKQIRSINCGRLAVSALCIVAGFACAIYLLSGISLESPIGIQNYDNPFHFSVVRLILETGVASPVGAGSVMGESAAVYPSLWHTLVAFNSELFTIQITESAWTICLLFVGLIAPIGTIIMSRTILGQPNYCSIFLAAVLPVITVKSLTYFMVFGTLFANLTGLCLLPLALALIVFLQQHATTPKAINMFSNATLGTVPGTTKSFARHARANSTSAVSTNQNTTKIVSLVGACVTSILALGLAHPSTVFVLFIFLIPFAISQCKKLWSKAIILLSSIICWLALMQSSLFFRTINCTDRIPDDIQLGQAYLSALHLDYSALVALDFLPVLLFVLCLIVGIGLARLLRKKFANGWYFISLAFIIGQVICSLFPENWFSIIATGFWYRDCPRMVVIFLFMATCLIAYFPTFCTRFAGKFNVVRNHKVIQIAISSVICLVCIAVLTHGNDYRYQLETMSTTDALTPNEIAFMEDVSRITNGAVVLNNADDNSVWFYPTYAVNALIKGRPANQMSPMSDNLCLIVEGIDQIGSDSDYGKQVRAAAHELDLKYVVKMSDMPSPTMRFTELSQVAYVPCYAITRVNEDTPGLELIYEFDGMQLFQVEASV